LDELSVFLLESFGLLRVFLPGFCWDALMLGFQIWVLFNGVDRMVDIGKFSLQLLFLLLGLGKLMSSLLLFVSVLGFSHRVIPVWTDDSIAVDNLFGDWIVELLYSRLREVLCFGRSLIEQVLKVGNALGTVFLRHNFIIYKKTNKLFNSNRKITLK
jgi:hypothetical protein